MSKLDSGWGYRVIRKTYPFPDGTIEEQFGIHEVYYSDGKPSSCTMNPTEVVAESVEGLKEDLEVRLTALEKPILNWEDFESKDENKEGD
jgi:hypothetical protein